MNRTEKIRKRIDEAYYEGYELADDIQHLLSKLDIAEKALELAVKELDAHDQNEHMEYGDFCSEYKPCAELTTIKEALDKIRA